jgi:peptidoglycan/LPS O-acetylase OafA/YrhL
MIGDNKITAPARRLTSLDAVRGIASFIVVLCHIHGGLSDQLREQLGASIWARAVTLFTNGDAAVIIFFMLSGYVLALPFFRHAQPPYLQFAWKRFCRIYIPFAAAIILAIFLHPFDAPTPKEIAGHFLMVGTGHNVKLDVAMWSLVYEMRISLIFPLLILLCRNTRTAFVSAVIMLVVSTRILVAKGDMSPFTVEPFWVTLIWTVRVMPYFIFGILLSKHAASIKERMDGLPWKAWLLLVPLAIFLIPHGGYLSIRRDTIYDIAAALLILLALDAPAVTRALNHRALQWLGRISYSLYLVHVPILTALFSRMAGQPIWLFAITGIAASLLAASVMHSLVELPAIRLGQRRVVRAVRSTTSDPVIAGPPG